MMETPSANSGKEWSEMDLTDLQHCIKIGMSETDIAGFLRRTIVEVRERAAELWGFRSPSKDTKTESRH